MRGLKKRVVRLQRLMIPKNRLVTAWRHDDGDYHVEGRLMGEKEFNNFKEAAEKVNVKVLVIGWLPSEEVEI